MLIFITRFVRIVEYGHTTYKQIDNKNRSQKKFLKTWKYPWTLILLLKQIVLRIGGYVKCEDVKSLDPR